MIDLKKVVDIGEPAMKPLYLIIYKSPNRGVYEYLCAYALYQISGYDFFWSTTDEFMENFNAHILAEKAGEQQICDFYFISPSIFYNKSQLYIDKWISIYK